MPAQAERVRCRDRPAYRGERNAAHAKSAVTDYFFTLAFGGERTKSVGQRAGKSEAYLLSTYRNVCEKGINGIHGTNCVFKFQDAVLAVFVGRGAQPDPLRPGKEWVLLPMVNFNIRPLGGIENKEVKKQFLLLARQTILFKDGRTLASKFATPQSLVDFCKSSPDANKTDGDCDLDEIRRPGVKEGLQIDVVHQVGPDANNFSSLFSVRVVKRD